MVAPESGPSQRSSLFFEELATLCPGWLTVTHLSLYDDLRFDAGYC